MADALRLEKLSAPLGALVSEIDLASQGADLADALNDALAQHLVLFFRDQRLSPASLYELANALGKPIRYPFVEGLPDYPEVVEVLKTPDETVNFGGVWHSDTAYLETPAMGALLYGVEIPKQGGDTIFTNMHDVWASLSPGLQSFLSSLNAVNDADNDAISRTRPGQARKGLVAEHPVVRTHPVTGRKLLYVNRAHTTRFSGMTEAESKALLEFLFSRIAEPAYSCRFSWQPGSLAFWDNRACQHYPVNDYHGEQRRMLRISLAGGRPVND